MERSPNVSAPMARRIARRLDSGFQPSISGRRVVLHDLVLVRATGEEAPAAEEVRRQAAARGTPMDISFWNRAAEVERQGNRIYGFDLPGNRHLIAQRRNNQRVVTATGRRCYEEMPQTNWIIHLPVIIGVPVKTARTPSSTPTSPTWRTYGANIYAQWP